MNHEPDTIRDKFNCPFVIFRFRSIPSTSICIVIKMVKDKILASIKWHDFFPPW
jgi:hypothetical protein